MTKSLLPILLFLLLCLAVPVHKCYAMDDVDDGSVKTGTDVVSIWDGTSVRDKDVTLEVVLPYNISRPTPAMIVCPGGSYCWHDYDTEGITVARWLAANGIAAFVLKYRVQGVFNYVTHMRMLFRGHHHPQMLQDGQRAIQYVREHAAAYNIDPQRLGVMGFSAGGHLAMSLAEYFGTDFLAPLDINSTVSLRPDFVVPVYPVVTLRGDFVHKRSRRALLGEYGKFRRSMRDSLSLERHVPDNCPPVFLVNCRDDRVVKYQNSVLLDSALTVHNIPHRYILYNTGNHGFGASDTKGTAECRQWRTEFLDWLRKIGML